MVYIREAHALDGSSPITRPGSPLVEEPLTEEERREVACACIDDLGLGAIPALVDGIDDAVEKAWHAAPDRLYLVGKDGRVAYRGGPGPFGFDPDELGEAIARELEQGTETP